MIVVMRSGASATEVQAVVKRVEELGYQAHLSAGRERTIIGVIGDERPLNEAAFHLLDGVDKVVRILKPYKLASRDFHPQDTVVAINGIRVGGPRVTVIAGPCSVESREQLLETALAVKEAGATLLRAGAFKPRTSPYSFQGLGPRALELLAEVKETVSMPIVTEAMAPEQVPLVAEVADVIQIGTRNMQNFALLHAAGESGKPVLLKRGMMSTMEELLMSAEYILSHGNYGVILCERGIRTFETYTRNTLDLAAVPVLKQMTHLPILVDPSHATGNWEWVTPLALAGIAAGADGLLIEVHPHPERALSDGTQSLRPERFGALVAKVRAVAEAVGRSV
ncbi:MAG TPA: 3-deoxy-7-phosphoheptulonate synthase [Chloroflexi bacterium]|jgi:3-deoxy-7-phosphoheptulonate synthase|nr:3-deoxy-7-phosphoheptulonate synthase [Chloroflexota bacterium]